MVIEWSLNTMNDTCLKYVTGRNIMVLASDYIISNFEVQSHICLVKVLDNKTKANYRLKYLHILLIPIYI